MKTNFLIAALQLSYAATYGCGAEEAVHVCHDCPDGREREYGRVRAGGFIRKSSLADLLANPISKIAWDLLKSEGKVIILPETAGSFDPGEPKELKGYGDRKSSYGPRTMKLTIIDPDYVDNYAFYNGISNRTDLVPFYLTSSLIHIFDKPASIKAKDPVEDDLESEITWQVECEIVSNNLPSKHLYENIKEVFACSTF